MPQKKNTHTFNDPYARVLHALHKWEVAPPSGSESISGEILLKGLIGAFNLTNFFKYNSSKALKLAPLSEVVQRVESVLSSLEPEEQMRLSRILVAAIDQRYTVSQMDHMVEGLQKDIDEAVTHTHSLKKDMDAYRRYMQMQKQKGVVHQSQEELDMLKTVGRDMEQLQQKRDALKKEQAHLRQLHGQFLGGQQRFLEEAHRGIALLQGKHLLGQGSTEQVSNHPSSVDPVLSHTRIFLDNEQDHENRGEEKVSGQPLPPHLDIKGPLSTQLGPMSTQVGPVNWGDGRSGLPAPSSSTPELRYPDPVPQPTLRQEKVLEQQMEKQQQMEKKAKEVRELLEDLKNNKQVTAERIVTVMNQASKDFMPRLNSIPKLNMR